MNDETYTPCTKCGRPMAYCKGECCGKPKGCDCHEYGPCAITGIRPCEPKCPPQAVIPTITVEDISGLKDLSDCFVHVSNINTTFYIDDKHRTIITWAGPVNVTDYTMTDIVENKLGLRNQFLWNYNTSQDRLLLVWYDAQGIAWGVADANKIDASEPQ